MLLFVVASRFW